MHVERALRLLAGIMILLSVVLSLSHSIQWLWLSGFVGANLLQSAFTNWCPAAWIFQKAGLNRCEQVSGSRPCAEASRTS